MFRLTPLICGHCAEEFRPKEKELRQRSCQCPHCQEFNDLSQTPPKPGFREDACKVLAFAYPIVYGALLQRFQSAGLSVHALAGILLVVLLVVLQSLNILRYQPLIDSHNLAQDPYTEKRPGTYLIPLVLLALITGSMAVAYPQLPRWTAEFQERSLQQAIETYSQEIEQLWRNQPQAFAETAAYLLDHPDVYLVIEEDSDFLQAPELQPKWAEIQPALENRSLHILTHGPREVRFSFYYHKDPITKNTFFWRVLLLYRQDPAEDYDLSSYPSEAVGPLRALDDHWSLGYLTY